MQVIFTVVAIFAFGVCAVVLTHGASERQAHMDCAIWQSEAAQYSQYFILAWQQEECASIGVTINAPLHAN